MTAAVNSFGLNLPDYPWEAMAPYLAKASEHPDGAVNLSIGTPVDPTPALIQDALKAGETDRRLHNLVTWRETPFFTEDERAILALTEEATLITGRISDQTFNEAVSILGEKYVAHALLAIISINGWNRIGVGFNMMPS